MLRMPAPLQVLAALSWGATIAADAADTSERIWLPLIAVSGVLSLCALMQAAVTRRIDRVYTAMARSFITRPADGARAEVPTTPADSWPAVRLRPVPAAQNGGRHNGHGRHASR